MLGIMLIGAIRIILQSENTSLVIYKLKNKMVAHPHQTLDCTSCHRRFFIVANLKH